MDDSSHLPGRTIRRFVGPGPRARAADA